MNDKPRRLYRRATIKDLSAELGLSISTISRAFTRPHMLRSETVERIRRLAAEVGYQPNLAARDLKTRSTGLVFVIVPSLHPFFLEVLRGIEDAAQETGHTVVMGHSNRDPHREAECFDQVASGRADGVILVSSVRRGAIARDARRLPPTVVALEAVDGPALPTVRIDDVRSGADATLHLIKLGHTKLAHIAGPRASPMARHRKQGFLLALSEAGLPADTGICLQGQSTVQSGQRVLQKLLKEGERPTAIFAANDEMAVGAIRAAKNVGLRVPNDLSIIGFNDQGLAEIYDPPLSTMRVPTFELGRQSMLTLKRVFDDEEVEGVDEIFPTKLIERATTAPFRTDSVAMKAI